MGAGRRSRTVPARRIAASVSCVLHTTQVRKMSSFLHTGGPAGNSEVRRVRVLVGDDLPALLQSLTAREETRRPRSRASKGRRGV
jgi:hypothetical protein